MRGAFDHRRKGIGVSDVELDCFDPAALCRDAVARAVEQRLPATADDDLSAALRQQGGGREADAIAAARDDGDAALKILAHSTSRTSPNRIALLPRPVRCDSGSFRIRSL